MEQFLNLPFKSEFFIDVILLFTTSIALVITCLRLLISKNLLESLIIMSVSSILLSICYLFMDAPDVAMTETALGACLSTCVLLNIINMVGEEEGSRSSLRIWLAALLCLIIIACLAWAVNDLPLFGSEDAPIQTHLTKYYVENTHKDIGIPSMVAAILGSYRGFDTLGETIVIFIAGLAVFLTMSRKEKKEKRDA